MGSQAGSRSYKINSEGHYRVTAMMRKGSSEPECSGMTQDFGTEGLEIWEAVWASLEWRLYRQKEACMEKEETKSVL